MSQDNYDKMFDFQVLIQILNFWQTFQFRSKKKLVDRDFVIYKVVLGWERFGSFDLQEEFVKGHENEWLKWRSIEMKVHVQNVRTNFLLLFTDKVVHEYHFHSDDGSNLNS